MGEAFYLQSQNGNIYPTEPSEFECLREDVPSGISWASKALGSFEIERLFHHSRNYGFIGRSPDAVNIWIGDKRSVTSVHSGQYNLFHQFDKTAPTNHPNLRSL